MQTRYVESANARIFVKEAGAGSPVLFLHGNPDSADIWDRMIDAMRSSFHCIAPDLPGFGRSTAPAHFDASLEGLARFVDAFVTAAGISEPLRLVMHDFGGLFGLAWAVRHPEKVRGLAVMNTLFFPDYRWHPWARVWRTPLLGELSMSLMNRWIFERELRRGSRKLSIQQIRDTYKFVTPPMKRMVLKLYRAADPELLAGWDTELLSLAARVPTIVLWGDHDPYIGSRFAERFGAAEVHHFADCGHWLPAEEPSAVACELLRFFGAR